MGRTVGSGSLAGYVEGQIDCTSCSLHPARDAGQHRADSPCSPIFWRACSAYRTRCFRRRLLHESRSRLGPHPRCGQLSSLPRHHQRPCVSGSDRGYRFDYFFRRDGGSRTNVLLLDSSPGGRAGQFVERVQRRLPGRGAYEPVRSDRPATASRRTVRKPRHRRQGLSRQGAVLGRADLGDPDGLLRDLPPAAERRFRPALDDRVRPFAEPR